MLNDLSSISLTCPYLSVEGEERSVRRKEGQCNIWEERNERKGKKGNEDLMFGAE
jgi:hypothetical protein